jgi:hypothetical protein
MSDLPESRRTAARRGTRSRTVLRIVLALVLLLVLAVAWVGIRGVLAKNHLEAAVGDVDTLRSHLTEGDSAAAKKAAERLEDDAASARALTGDPIWSAAQYVPFFGPNLRAVREVSVIVDTVASGAVSPVAGAVGSFSQDSFAPRDGKVNLAPIEKAQPAVAKATSTLASAEKAANSIDTGATLSPVTRAVDQLRNALSSVAQQAAIANRIVQLAPAMLGHDGDRKYLLLFQNNAELRSGGGIPGAVALLKVRDGRIHLENQAAGGSFGPYDKSVLPLDEETQGLFGAITGRYMQDVTLTPRFETSAELAREMWKRKFGDQVDGVLALDPVTLAYILKATGPVQLPTGDTLTSDNAVKLLLSDVYSKYPEPAVQDVFFASAASAVFDKVSAGGFDARQFIDGLTQAAGENRLRLWSANAAEERQIVGTAVAGDLPKETAQSREFGVYLNDATGAKMDYYLQKNIAVGSAVCRSDGRPTSVVDVTLSSTAPMDAATSLPEYVTGAGDFGVEPGKVRTNVLVYAPKGSIYLSATQDGKPAGVQPALDGGNAVIQAQVLLSPGQTTTLRVAFLGEAANAKAAVRAESTPGVQQTAVQPAQFTCSDPTAG